MAAVAETEAIEASGATTAAPERQATTAATVATPPTQHTVHLREAARAARAVEAGQRRSGTPIGDGALGQGVALRRAARLKTPRCDAARRPRLAAR
jgi:hypothetical protein